MKEKKEQVRNEKSNIEKSIQKIFGLLFDILNIKKKYIYNIIKKKLSDFKEITFIGILHIYTKL